MSHILRIPKSDYHKVIERFQIVEVVKGVNMRDED
jgi:hypothetical protein